VNYKDLEKFLSQEFGKKYPLTAREEWVNDSTNEFEVTGELSEEATDAVSEFRKSGQGKFIIESLFEDLASRGVVLPGTYQVNISW
jgi:hypothetical protein